MSRILSSPNCLGAFLGTALMMIHPITAQAAPEDAIDFDRDIRPILSEHCFKCHGPDEHERRGKLRLDTREGALSRRDSHAIIEPGHRGAIELFRRVTTEVLDDRMPPEKAGKPLRAEQIAMIGRWIDQGAPWQSHWAFRPLTDSAVPAVKKESWPRNPIDRFILAKLEKEGLEPNPEAGRTTLLRRATVDLTGLPPTLEELDAFLGDESAEAYDRAVDRLLNSAHYGEQMARDWLDAARYGDSHGYHIDAERIVWRWRDWVIDAFNQNMPFDQFTIEQIAGDLLPEPTLDQRIATGFNRCNMTTGEGGAIPEEYLAKYAIDRVDTTSTVWLGLTMACAQCHDHKYDPITQKDFYRFFAFFNNVAEQGLDGNAPAPEPFLKAPRPSQALAWQELQGRLQALSARLDGPLPETDAAQAQWDSAWSEKLRKQWRTLEPATFASQNGATLERLPDLSILAKGHNPDQDVYEVTARTDAVGIGLIRLDALTDASLPHNGAARSANANFVLSEFEVEIAPVDKSSAPQPVELVTAYADYAQPKFEIRLAVDGKPETGWAVDGDKRRENRAAFFVPKAPFGFPGGTELRFRLKFQTQFGQHAIGRVRLAVSSDRDAYQPLTPTTIGSWNVIGPFTAASGDAAFITAFPPEQEIKLKETYPQGKTKLKWQVKTEFEDGKVHNLAGDNAATYLHRVIFSPRSQIWPISLGSDDALKVWLNGKLVLERQVQRGAAPDQDKLSLELQPGENALVLKVVNYSGGYAFYFNSLGQEEQMPAQIALLLATPADQRTDEQRKALREFYRRQHSPVWKEGQAELTHLRGEEKKLDAEIPTTLVMREREQPRDTFVLVRGEYDRPGEKVSPGIPSNLPGLSEGAPTNRLGLARWLVAPTNPLTARVTVNRFWQHYFGTGLVRTAEDFGSQGERPSHPQLLDWLALEFMRSGWDVKHLQRLIVTSSTYRQSSRYRPELRERDPQNRWLARGPRFRMDAEVIRDSALAAGGLLVDRIGGPSVKPYQPAGLWTAVTYGRGRDYVQDQGQGLYRRSLYTFWKRTVPPPNLLTFDAPSRETCIVRRPRTNTPLQALVLLNDPQFVEAARGLAERMMTQGGSSPADRIRLGFRIATARTPQPDEVQTLVDLYEAQLADYQARKEAAEKLIRVGDAIPSASLDACELAAWTTVASILLNLDEAITKG